MRHSHATPTRVLPNRPSVARLRKQAKDLLKSYRAAEQFAVGEVERFEQSPDPSRFVLADAQRVLARAYGFSSWIALTQHVDEVNVRVFCEAVDSGNVGAVRKLATARPELVNVNRGGEFGEKIALHFAVLNRDMEMTRVLMQLGADARKGIWPHRDATTAFTIAQDRGYDDITAAIEHEEQLRRRSLSTPGTTISPAADQVRQAILDGRSEDARQILESDLSLVGACDSFGATPLHFAAQEQDNALIAWLLDHDAAVNAQAPSDVPPRMSVVPGGAGKTPLDYAATIAGSSAHGRDFSFLENSTLQPQRFEETVRMLRSHGARLTPRAAVAIGDAEAVRRLHRDGQLKNDIHLFRGGLLSIAVRVNRLEMVTLLLDLGIDVDESVTSDDGNHSWGMPLWYATMCSRPEIARLLLSRGADVNAIVYACGDALSIANTTRDESMQNLLIQRGARLTVEHVAGSCDRDTARAILDRTVSAQSLNVPEPSHADLAEQMLWAAGGCDPEIVRLCLPHVEKPADDPWWNYVLMHATLPGSMELILQHGVDPDVTGNGGYTMLHHLSAQNSNDPEGVILATMLLDKGASLKKRDPLLKSTPLGWACRWGQSELVKLFLKRGADPVEAEAEPWATPLSWARRGNHQEITEWLVSRPPD